MSSGPRERCEILSIKTFQHVFLAKCLVCKGFRLSSTGCVNDLLNSKASNLRAFLPILGKRLNERIFPIQLIKYEKSKNVGKDMKKQTNINDKKSLCISLQKLTKRLQNIRTEAPKTPDFIGEKLRAITLG